MNDWSPEPPPQRIGIYGGTFDPIHHGHLVAAAEVQFTLALDTVVFMPAGVPPHKQHLAITPARDRVQMIALAIAGRTHFALSQRDLAPDRPSYTAELLAQLQTVWGPQHTLFFIMGEDALDDFPGWHAPDQIASLAEIVVVTRPDVEVALDQVVAKVPALTNRLHLVPIPQLAIASNDLRTRVAAGYPIAYQVPTVVEDYIRDAGLYR